MQCNKRKVPITHVQYRERYSCMLKADVSQNDDVMRLRLVSFNVVWLEQSVIQ